MTTDVSVAQKATRRKLNLLELAEEMGNVSKACKIAGIPGSSFMKSEGITRHTDMKACWINYQEPPAPIPIGCQERLRRPYLIIH